MVDPVIRSLPADVQTEIAIDFTRPVYLVKMLFPSGTRYLSTNIQIDYDGDTYIEGQVSVGSFIWNADGSQSGSITLSNEANAASALLLAGTTNDVLIEIYKTYLISGGGNTTPVVYSKGSMDGGTIGASKSVVQVVSTTAQSAFVPNRYHTVDEGFNWLPVSGETITWGEEIFVLQEERG